MSHPDGPTGERGGRSAGVGGSAGDGSARRWRDGVGKRLTDYPRPSVAVDTAVLTVPMVDTSTSWTRVPPLLSVLLVAADDGRPRWLLPGTFLHEGERLADAVLRSLGEKAGVRGLAPRQLRVFDEPARDDRGWVLSVAHAVTVPWDVVAEAVAASEHVTTRPVGAASGLPFDHDAIVAAAVDALRAEYRDRPDPAGLLPEPFTLRQLQHLHQAVLGVELQKDTFRRRMEPLLEPVGELSAGTVGKPARLFRRAGGGGVRRFGAGTEQE